MTFDPDSLLIVVDSRELPSGILEHLKSEELFELRTEQLSCGDYLIADLVVERKTISDLLRSLEDGRLFKQVYLMRRLYRRRALLIEGTWPETIGTQNAKIEGALVKISTGLQVPVLFSRSVSHTAVLLKRMALQLYRLTVTSPVRRRPESREDVIFQQRYVLLGFPGIGIARADALLSTFGTLQRVFAADIQSLAQVPGIGEINAERIHELLHAQPPPSRCPDM